MVSATSEMSFPARRRWSAVRRFVGPAGPGIADVFHSQSGYGEFALEAPGRPFGLVIVAILWGAEAVANIVIAFVLNGPQSTPALQYLAPELVVQDYSLRLWLQFLSLVQFYIAYEIVRGGFWSYIGGLGLSACDFLIFADLTYLYYTAPARMNLPTPLLLVSLGMSTLFAILIWVYFNTPKASNYLKRWW